MRPEAAPLTVRPRAALLTAALAIVLVLGVAAGREASIGMSAVEAADAAASKSDWPEAIAHAREAAEALVPGAPWRERGFRRLEAIGRDALARGDDRMALLAYGAMRTAAIETIAPGSGSEQWKASGEDGLARVAAAQRDPTIPLVSADTMIEALRRTERPTVSVLAVLSVSALALLGGIAGLLVGFANDRARRTCQAAAVAGFVAYAIALLTR
jgi:hypothetical protein